MENWHRFLEDFCIAFDTNNIDLNQLFDILHNIHDYIQFKMEEHSLYLPFLDIMINKDPETNNIWMDIFCNETNTPICVPFNSCHPKQCKSKIHFTLARRIFTTVENSKVIKKRLNKLQKVLFSQEYPQNLNKEAIRKAASIPIGNSRLQKLKLIATSLRLLQFSIQITKTYVSKEWNKRMKQMNKNKRMF